MKTPNVYSANTTCPAADGPSALATLLDIATSRDIGRRAGVFPRSNKAGTFPLDLNSRRKGLAMAESNREREERVQAEKEFRVRFLMRETGITEPQARELIGLIGNDANSLLREARLLARKQT
ncbi:MAG: hypothetical protein EOQ57_17165 [Mesorhizobium sp.]|uniref:hypothetical protein n=1 Tax=Mesorhizobium sp. TaxID=1871066 RepID=UPI000FE56908|nr:hypothetical protein [Mesorhizobium sp.]RWC00325.1 MAG: hypothetical protein EOQ57_17165 [Mesorhizobium sp.]